MRVEIVWFFIFAIPFVTVKCSIAFHPKWRVVGGIDAFENMAPFIVSLQHNGIHYCGGSIINERSVVTAAHCVSSKQVALNSLLIAGSLDVGGKAETAQKRHIIDYVIHDLYVGGIAPYDIALVFTKDRFQWTMAVGPIALPTSANINPSGQADLYGWGSTSKILGNEIYPGKLQVARNIPIISLEECERVLGTAAGQLHETNVCTGPLTGGIGICTSDSGGPLVQQTPGASKVTLIGIVSWGKVPCGQKNSPSVYARVSSFTEWIEKNKVLGDD